MSAGAGRSATRDLEEVVRSTVARHLLFRSGDRVLVGFSGGPDSLALLHLLWTLAAELGIEVRAAHLNHGLRGQESEADAEFARQTCTCWGIPIAVEEADVAAVAVERRLAVEEAARQVRYGFLGRVAGETGCSAVAVGHNADDQVETVLMHLLRGSGLGGLRGMVPSAPLSGLRLGPEGAVPADVRLVRPLLQAPRSMIEAYCAEHELQPRFDRSNLDTTYFRNRVRHELIPFLEGFNPNLRAVVRRSAAVLGADYDYLVGERNRAWRQVVRRATPTQVLFDLESFRALHLSLRRALIRRSIAHLRPPLRNIDWVHVEQAVEAVQTAAGAGVRAGLPQGLMLTVDYDSFSVADAEAPMLVAAEYPQLAAEASALPMPTPGEAELAGDWRARCDLVPRRALPQEALRGEHPWTAYLDDAVCRGGLQWRTRRPGDRIQPLGMEGRGKKVSEVMINAKVPARCRGRYPILACDDLVLWLPGLHVDHRAQVKESTTRVAVVRLERT